VNATYATSSTRAKNFFGSIAFTTPPIPVTMGRIIRDSDDESDAQSPILQAFATEDHDVGQDNVQLSTANAISTG
jgi:hypothetical protein